MKSKPSRFLTGIIILLCLICTSSSFGDPQESAEAKMSAHNTELIKLWKAYRQFDDTFSYYEAFFSQFMTTMYDHDIEFSPTSWNYDPTIAAGPDTCATWPFCIIRIYDLQEGLDKCVSALQNYRDLVDEIISQIEASGQIDMNQPIGFYISDPPRRK